MHGVKPQGERNVASWNDHLKEYIWDSPFEVINIHSFRENPLSKEEEIMINRNKNTQAFWREDVHS